jgi:hypothetical protein
MISWNRKPKATKRRDHCTYSKSSSENNWKKYIETEDGLWEVQFPFTGGKGLRDTIGTLRLNSRRTLNTDKVCACFIHGELVFQCLNWTKKLHIIKNTNIDLCEKKYQQRIYTEQSVLLRPKRKEISNILKTGREVRQGCRYSPSLFKLYSE